MASVLPEGLKRGRTGHSPRGIATLIPAALLLAACATPGTHQVQVDLDHIQQQLWAIQKENAALTDEVARMREAGGPNTALGGSAIDLRMERLDQELARLQTRLDDTDQRITAVVQDLRTTRDALQALVATLPAGAGPSAGSLDTLPTGENQIERGASVAGAPTSVPPPRAVTTPLALENLYRQGYADYTKGNYALALQELAEFQQRYPDSPLADDAQYLRGEVHFSQQHYPEAIEVFDQLVREYPGGDKIGPAYLKKGLALLEMNRTADAVVQLQHVIDMYPESEEARIARDRLRNLGLRER
ncbi:MAG: tol-pal system protein YbgF [Acidobacteria bacterium]|nr:tol-pal system protein YbgF [Acidobacteriota bacterium]